MASIQARMTRIKMKRWCGTWVYLAWITWQKFPAFVTQNKNAFPCGFLCRKRPAAQLSKRPNPQPGHRSKWQSNFKISQQTRDQNHIESRCIHIGDHSRGICIKELALQGTIHRFGKLLQYAGWFGAEKRQPRVLRWRLLESQQCIGRENFQNMAKFSYRFDHVFCRVSTLHHHHANVAKLWKCNHRVCGACCYTVGQPFDFICRHCLMGRSFKHFKTSPIAWFFFRLKHV